MPNYLVTFHLRTGKQINQIQKCRDAVQALVDKHQARQKKAQNFA